MYSGARPPLKKIVHHHLKDPLLRPRYHRLESRLLEPVVRIERVERLGRIADDDEHAVRW
jgi:hypothetical protein